MAFNIFTVLLISMISILTTGMFFKKGTDYGEEKVYHAAVYLWIAQILSALWVISYMNWWR